MNYKLSEDGKILEHVDVNVTSFIVPDSVIEIGYLAFNGCDKLISVDMFNVTKINNSSFSGCSNLIEVNMPNVKTIDNYAFSGCYNLIEVNIPNVICISNNVFNYCFNLRILKIPKLKIIHWLFLSDCINLIHIDSKLNEKQIIDAFGSEEKYYNYLQRNREYKLKILDDGL